MQPAASEHETTRLYGATFVNDIAQLSVDRLIEVEICTVRCASRFSMLDRGFDTGSDFRKRSPTRKLPNTMLYLVSYSQILISTLDSTYVELSAVLGSMCSVFSIIQSLVIRYRSNIRPHVE